MSDFKGIRGRTQWSAASLARPTVRTRGRLTKRRNTNEQIHGIRGRIWFKALTGQETPMPGDPPSVLVADALIGNDNARFLCVVPDPDSRFPCARHGEVGLEQAYTLAARIREVIVQPDLNKTVRNVRSLRSSTSKARLTADAKKSPGFISLRLPQQTRTPLPGSPVTRSSR